MARGDFQWVCLSVQIGDLEQELVWSLLAKPPVPPQEAKSNQPPDSGLFESSGTRGYTAGGPLSEKWSEIFPQEQGRRGLRLDDKSWTSYLRCPSILNMLLVALPFRFEGTSGCHTKGGWVCVHRVGSLPGMLQFWAFSFFPTSKGWGYLFCTLEAGQSTLLTEVKLKSTLSVPAGRSGWFQIPLLAGFWSSSNTAPF